MISLSAIVSLLELATTGASMIELARRKLFSYFFDSVGGSFGVSGRAQEKLLLSNGCDLVTPDFFQQLPAQQLQQLGEVRGYAPRLVALPGLSWDIEWQTCDENRNSAGA